MQTRIAWFGLGAFLTALALFLIYQLPPVRYRVEWRLDALNGIVRGWLYPGDTLPTPAGRALGTRAPARTPTPAPVSTGPSPSPSPTWPPLPQSAQLSSPEWDKQDWNNCGPATLALTLRMYGWDGDQFDISDLLKPDRGDKNVNIEELVYYVRTRAGWLNADFRVGGTLDVLKRFLAAGYPIVIEKGLLLAQDEAGGGWSGHYLLLTGYDDARQMFRSQDSYKGADQEVSYADLDEGWQTFNRVFLFLYRPEEQAVIDALLGPDAEADTNRQLALDTAQAEVNVDPDNPYAWFNLGTNLVYFERYGEAADAFDTALSIGLPWRFTRYQFGPYLAYFNQGRFEDVVELADATLYRTNKAEESLLWRGWARFRMGNTLGAIEDFRSALVIHPGYEDALYALEFVGSSP
ncbi:MAG: C39 family peptidase [Anaerolineales bacterium]